MNRLITQALALLNQKIEDGLEYGDAVTFVIATLGLTEEESDELAVAYDPQGAAS